MKKLVMGLVVLALTACGGTKGELRSDFDIPSPTVVRSVNDLPKPIVSRQDILKTGTIRVIAESGKDQNQYEALEASRIEAQRSILAVISGANLESSEAVTLGILTKDDITRAITGTIRSFNCGDFYDSVARIGYSCQESSLK